MNTTIKDIAKESGVSKTTVSRYINNSGYVSEDTATKIQSAIDRMNYVPSATARSLSNRRSTVIGVVVPEVHNPFFAEVYSGISEVAEANDLSVIYVDTKNNVEKELNALSMLRTYDICGLVITLSGSNDDNEYVEKFTSLVESLKVPVVLLDRKLEDSKWPGVYSDNESGAYEGTKLLIENGHSRIATITGDQDLILGKDRHKGFLNAIDSLGVDKESIIVKNGDFTKDTGYSLTKELLNLDNKPSAIFSPNNLTTMGVLKAIFEKGLQIPKDIALVGFDDIELLNDLHIPLSVLKRDTVNLGVNCMNLLVDQINNETKEYEDIVIHPELIVRGSEKLV